jgi:hypothetical protein
MLLPIQEGGAEKLEAGVGTLVKFDQRGRPASKRPRNVAGAQILLFTGVRYERGTPSMPNNRVDPSRPKRKRV